jgi:hypothetical protein
VPLTFRTTLYSLIAPPSGFLLPNSAAPVLLSICLYSSPPVLAVGFLPVWVSSAPVIFLGMGSYRH